MRLVRSFAITGNDGRVYTVEERERPGIPTRPLSGPSAVVSSGIVEYMLAGGGDLVDDTPGHWEILATGVLLKKPDNL